MAEDKFAYKDKENTFTEANTFNEGITVGSTPLTSASLKNIVEQTNKVPTIESNISAIPQTYRTINDSYSKTEIDEKLKNTGTTYTAGNGIKIEDNVISQDLFIITDVEISDN